MSRCFFLPNLNKEQSNKIARCYKINENSRLQRALVDAFTFSGLVWKEEKTILQ